MGETQRRQPEQELLDDLAMYGDGIYSRMEEILAGLSPNGEHPNGVLSQALESDSPEAQQNFIDEYGWALYITIYPHRNKEDKEVLMGAAVDGLFMAGETYDEEAEPNFLRHLGATVSGYLEEVFGEAPSTDLPTPDEFEEFVLEHYVVETVPPLPSEREAASFRPGQRLLTLMGVELAGTKVVNVQAYKGVWKPEAAEVPPKELEKRERYFRQYYRDSKRGARDALMPRSNALPDPEYIRRFQLLHPAFQRLVPSTRPGFVRVRKTEQGSAGPRGLIIDMDRPEVMPLDAWRRIRGDESYTRAYLLDGLSGDPRKRAILEQAIKRRIEVEEKSDRRAADNELVEDSPRRARHHNLPPSGLPALEYNNSSC